MSMRLPNIENQYVIAYTGSRTGTVIQLQFVRCLLLGHMYLVVVNMFHRP